jgi:hypothetical protein
MYVLIDSMVTGDVASVYLPNARYTFETTPEQQACSDGLQWGANAFGYSFPPGSDSLFVSTVKTADVQSEWQLSHHIAN